MLHLCNYITLVEFVQSPRARLRPCYYYNHITKPKTPKDSRRAAMIGAAYRQPPCSPAKPASGWHPHHMELAVLLKLGSIRPSVPGTGVGPFNATTYNGVLSLPVADVRVRRRIFDRRKRSSGTSNKRHRNDE